MPDPAPYAPPIGLTSAAAERLLGEVGPNLPPDRPPRSTVKRVVDQLRDPMLLLLQAAAVLSALLRDWPSTAIIVLVVVFNTTLGVPAAAAGRSRHGRARKAVSAHRLRAA
ncbi:cation-transporting P-type ATPase [Nocardioides glacieisoli]|uniref:cation-transporting P-type ATPase n=1 Tax=Nocardioides glacieisoli TaxID=1168730 RepID=UPI001F5DA4E1|nr:cation-transporting P-type ATPase [Nocardioides glacieisoli]